MTYQIKSKVKNNHVIFEFHKNGNNYGGRSYNLAFTNIEVAKSNFITWCGY